MDTLDRKMIHYTAKLLDISTEKYTKHFSQKYVSAKLIGRFNVMYTAFQRMNKLKYWLLKIGFYRHCDFV